MVPHLLNRIVDRHARFYLLSHFENDQIFKNVCKQMGKSFFFSFWNPSGHYYLNLSQTLEREVAQSLIVLNKEANKLMLEGQLSDRSIFGNKSCFRNEICNGAKIVLNQGKHSLLFSY